MFDNCLNLSIEIMRMNQVWSYASMRWHDRIKPHLFELECVEVSGRWWYKNSSIFLEIRFLYWKFSNLLKRPASEFHFY